MGHRILENQSGLLLYSPDAANSNLLSCQPCWTLKFQCAPYFLASEHISASQVTSGAALRAKFSRAVMMAFILFMVECEGELAA